MSNQNSRTASANNKMLIDATHPEETRVVVQRNGRVEEFDFESAARKLLRGNIYLAKVTRVEPSLQAAFVDYGGNRHGFLAFNEIHPDYYQIPVADRRALIEAETAAEAEEEEEAERAAEAAARRAERRRGPRGGNPRADAEETAVDVTSVLPAEEGDAARDERRDGDSEDAGGGRDARDDREAVSGGEVSGEDDGERRSLAERVEPDAVMRSSEPVETPREDDRPAEQAAGEHAAHEDHETGRQDAHSHAEHDDVRGEDDGRHDTRPHEHHAEEHRSDEGRGEEGRVETVEPTNGGEPEQIETVSANEDVLEEVPVRPRRRLRSYKIQEVIKRRQVLLVQVVKEERGTKGAALTTYLSLAGRYTVLMPNTARGGGISRKITNPQDRKRLKAIAAELDVPEGMGLIIRTAGAARTKQEIKRDYEYLLRLWESVRELALNSNAPALVYEEGNLIKRSIRDLYGKEVEEIVVAGEAAYHEARDFMRMLMPSHAKNVHHYEDPEPLFTRFGMERQLNAMFSPYVHLRSGGYLVINQTEALVAIDINSGKSTREFSIEETALSTNLEAADEIARQLKLRDLAGLIVIDFIDMEEKRNNRAVERRLKDALRHDRARIQLGRISHFGLLEMSRQRMRTGVLEGSTTQCPHCQGTGIIRSTESVALAVLRGLEDSLMTGQPASLTATTTATVALYILNHKRAFIVEMESRYGITIQIVASEKVQGANFTIEKQARREEPQRRVERTAVNMDWGFEDEEQEEVAEPEAADEEESSEAAAGSGGQNGEGRRRRRRRRGRRGDRDTQRGPQSRRDEEGREPQRASAEAQPYGDDEAEGEDAGYAANGHSHDDVVAEAGDVHGEPDGDSDADAEGDAGGAQAEGGEDQQGERRRRRRRGRRGGRRNHERGDKPEAAEAASEAASEAGDGAADDEQKPAGGADDVPAQEAVRSDVVEQEPVAVSVADEPVAASAQEAEAVADVEEQKPAAVGRTKGRERERDVPVVEAPAPVAAAPEEPAVEPVAPAVSSLRTSPVSSEPVLARVVVGPDAGSAAQVVEEEPRPARRGWWQRR